jgi:hypothetical protein
LTGDASPSAFTDLPPPNTRSSASGICCRGSLLQAANFVDISWGHAPIDAKQFRNATMGAPRGNKFANGNRGGGRPTLYQSKYAEIARRMCARGAIAPIFSA